MARKQSGPILGLRLSGGNMTEPAALRASDERFLRYWSTNMALALAQSGGTDWYGFSYSDGEKDRMRELAGAMPAAAFGTFLAVTVVGFLVMAGLAVAAILVPVMGRLYPDPAQTGAVAFVSTMAAICFLCLGLGLPLAMGWGAWAGDRWAGGRPQPPAPGDDALIGRIRSQLRRMSVIMVGIFVPGCLLFIAFDIDAGPLVFWLKLACAAVFAASVVRTVRTGRAG